MKLEEFLDRVIAPGNWMAIAHKGTNYHSMAHRFFDRANDVNSAAQYLRWASQTRQLETWYAMASYKEAAQTSDGKKYVGKRTYHNAQALKTFWADADIKRDGDGKDPTKVFVDDEHVVRWVTNFTKMTGFPRPNIWIKSGYGLHLYWSFEDALDVPTWKGYADWLKIMLAEGSFLGDLNVVADAARILRAPETFNYKVPTHPMPCFEFWPDKLTLPDYPNALLLPVITLDPKAKPLFTAHQMRPTTGSATSTGNAKAGLSHQPHDFQTMATNCAQVGQSLQTHGLDDGYELWFRMIRLTQFMQDGRTWAHDVSSAHPKYTIASTDAKYDDAVKAQKIGGYGPPLCTSINTAAANTPRAGVCAACPHWGKPHVTTPFHVAVPGFDDPDALPFGWRRHLGWIECKIDDNWTRIIEGDITRPSLIDIGGPYQFTITYTKPGGGKSTRIPLTNVELDSRTAKEIFNSRGMHVSNSNKRASLLCELIMSWISKLQHECRIRRDPMPSFGWYRDGAKYLGFATGSMCYVANGADEESPGADPALVERYTPQGDLAAWRKAAEFVAAGRPELHTLIAVAFASPLVELMGAEAGAVLNFVGPSGVGKSSGTRAGQAVWAHPIKAAFSVDDTANYKAKTAGDIRALPVYWDEARLDADVKRLISEIHKFTQGRDKGRLTSAITIRDPGVWATLYAISSNDSLRDLIAAQPENHDATLARILEIPVTTQVIENPVASTIVSSLGNNFGVAGKIYARYIADNTDLIQKVLRETLGNFSRQLDIKTDERFYMFSTVALLVGAKLAKRLSLMDFDIDGIFNTMKNSILISRGVRIEATPQDPVTQLTRQLNDFFNFYLDEFAVTNFFKKRGHSANPRVFREPLFAPKSGYGVVVHVGLDDKAVRINKQVWNAYWASHSGSGTSIRDEVMARWGITSGVEQRGLGQGTRYPSDSRCFTLSLDNPELVRFYEQWLPPTTGSGSAPVSTVIPMKRV